MSRWFRWYRGTTENPKFRLAARNGSVTLVTVFAVWQVILEDAANEDHRGICEKREDFIAAALDLDDDGTVEGALRGLEYVGLISVGVGFITVCDWAKWQYDHDVSDPTNADRQKRYRDRKRHPNGSVTGRNGDVTASNTPETDTEADTDKDPENKTPPHSTETRERESEGGRGIPFSEFQKDFPHHGGIVWKPAADEWGSLSPAEQRAAIAALPAFKTHIGQHKTTRPIAPRTYLAERRWEGFQPRVSTGVQIPQFATDEARAEFFRQRRLEAAA